MTQKKRVFFMPRLYSDIKNDCCGCYACKNICPKNAIVMEEDEKGFLYPVVNDNKCIECKLCEKICGFKIKIRENKEDLKVYALKADDDIRLQSTSGGAFTLLSDVLLEKGGVIYGAVMDENLKVKHIRADNSEERNLCRGSKYSQSDISDMYLSVRKDLEDGKYVLFTGTPCQVDGLNRFLSNADKNNLLLVDFICHGVMSPLLFRKYIKFIEKKRKKKVVKYFHRPKDYGWNHNEKIVFSDNSFEIRTRLSTIWKEIFYKNAGLRPSCFSCSYTNLKRPSDITIGDFWGIDHVDSEFYDNKGVSLVIINTKKGREWFDSIKEKCVYCEKNISDAVKKNPNLEMPSPYKVDQEIFWDDFHKYGIEYIAKKYGGYTVINRIKRWIKNFIKR